MAIHKTTKFTSDVAPGLFFDSEAEAEAYEALIDAEKEMWRRNAAYDDISLYDIFTAAKRRFAEDSDNSARKICEGICAYMVALGLRP